MPIKSLIRTVPHYPHQGIMFRDITTLLKDPVGLRAMVNKIVNRYTDVKIDKVVGIEEKPEDPKSDLAVTGIYFYDAGVFDIIRTVKPSGRGEMEITDVNNAYIAKDAMTYGTFNGWWSDAGTFPSLALASELVASEPVPFPNFIGKD